jgi:hypothetical protein
MPFVTIATLQPEWYSYNNGEIWNIQEPGYNEDYDTYWTYASNWYIKGAYYLVELLADTHFKLGTSDWIWG